MKRRIVLGCAAAALCAAMGSARPFKFHSKSRLLDFEYSWSPEVGAVPALVRHFTKDMREEQRRMLTEAREAREAKDAILPFAQRSFYRDITTAGRTSRFLSLKIETYSFTGGAHGTTYSEPFLWDREGRRAIAFDALLTDKNAKVRLLRSVFCHRLHTVRTRRNGQEMSGVFDQCPKLSELTIVPAAEGHRGRFDVIRLVADEDVAGSHAEGAYDIPVPVTAQLVAAIKPQYRSSFEAQRQ